MESQWQPVMRACMHWLYDTLYSGVLLKFPSSLPFCSAGGIMSNKKEQQVTGDEAGAEAVPDRSTSSLGRSRWRYAHVIHPGAVHHEGAGCGECIIAFKLHEGCFDDRLVWLPLPPCISAPGGFPPSLVTLPPKLSKDALMSVSHMKSKSFN